MALSVCGRGQDPKTIGQLAVWLQTLPLAELQDLGFFIMLVPGNTLYIPPGCFICEASIGEEGAAILSYPTLLTSQMSSWQSTWQHVQTLLNPNNASQMSVRASMSFVDRMLMLGSVKWEDDVDIELAKMAKNLNDKNVAAGISDTPGSAAKSNQRGSGDDSRAGAKVRFCMNQRTPLTL